MEDQSEDSLIDIGEEGIHMDIDIRTDPEPKQVRPFVPHRSNDALEAIFRKWEIMNSTPDEQTRLQQDGPEDEFMPMDIDEPVSEDTIMVSSPVVSPESSSAGTWNKRIWRKQARTIKRPTNPLHKMDKDSISLILRARLTASSNEGESSFSENNSIRRQFRDSFEVVDSMIPEGTMVDRPSELQEDVDTIFPEEMMVDQPFEIDTIALLEDLADSFSRFHLEGYLAGHAHNIDQQGYLESLSDSF